MYKSDYFASKYNNVTSLEETHHMVAIYISIACKYGKQHGALPTMELINFTYVHFQ